MRRAGSELEFLGYKRLVSKSPARGPVLLYMDFPLVYYDSESHIMLIWVWVYMHGLLWS